MEKRNQFQDFFKPIFIILSFILPEVGARSCGPLRSRVPALLNFSFAFPVPAFLYNIFLAFPRS